MRNGRARLLAPACALGGLAVVLQASPAPVRDALAYTRSAVAAGELWRLLTCHLVHLGWSHLALNLLACAVGVGLGARRTSAGIWWGSLAAGALGTALGLFLLRPGLSGYVGLSGALHGLFAGLAAALWREHGARGCGLGLLVAAKLAWEQIVGPLPSSHALAGGAVIVDAHLYGALGGLVWAGAYLVLRRPLKLAPRLRSDGPSSTGRSALECRSQAMILKRHS